MVMLMLQIVTVLITLSFRKMYSSQNEEDSGESQRVEEKVAEENVKRVHFALFCVEMGKKCWICDPKTLEEIVEIGILFNIYIMDN